MEQEPKRQPIHTVLHEDMVLYEGPSGREAFLAAMCNPQYHGSLIYLIDGRLCAEAGPPLREQFPSHPGISASLKPEPAPPAPMLSAIEEKLLTLNQERRVYWHRGRSQYETLAWKEQTDLFKETWTWFLEREMHPCFDHRIGIWQVKMPLEGNIT
jgi:hypothetical protein